MIALAFQRYAWPGCCTCIVSLCLLSAPVSAEQYGGLRLFHEPEHNDAAESQQSNHVQQQDAKSRSAELEKQSKKHYSKTEKRSAVLASNNADEKALHPIYKYNGFISTSAGRHYYINGTRLIDFDSLELVSVGHAGKSLVLKVVSGRVFKLSIGQSINTDLM